ncbi:MAG: hypothetical protein EPN97_04030 [Alphaproteobacteria bacterium]|nr:MAG: hypothetical protein EPN97_04030 [Alphaproteobacteria bacterium]
MFTVKKALVLSTALSAMLIATALTARADNSAGPAVAAPNVNFSAGGGVLDHDSKFLLSGTGTMPLSNAFGFQADGFEALGEGRNRGGLSAHLFQRDPSQHLIGLTTMWGRLGTTDIFRGGAEGEAYLDDFSLRLAGGWQNQEGDSTGYGNAKLSYYMTDNLVFALNGSAYSDSRGGGLEAEWKPSNNPYPFSLFASGGDRNDTDGYALAGVRVSFGDKGVSLKDRHRKYDPSSLIETFMTQENGGGNDDECAAPVVDGAGPFAIDGGGPVPCGGFPPPP